MQGAKLRGGTKRGARKAAAGSGSPLANEPMPVPKSPPPGRRSSSAEAPSRRAGGAARRRVASAPTPRAGDVVNELMPFLEFVEHHPIGTSVNGIVDAYSSHGAYISIGTDGVRGYIPLRLMSDPPPPSARKVMQIGEAVTVVVVSFAAARRSIDCAMPDMAAHAPVDTDPLAIEPVEQPRPARRGRGRKAARDSGRATRRAVAPGRARTGARCGGLSTPAEVPLTDGAGSEADLEEDDRRRSPPRPSTTPTAAAVAKQTAAGDGRAGGGEGGSRQEGAGQEGAGQEGGTRQAAPVREAAETEAPATILPAPPDPVDTAPGRDRWRSTHGRRSRSPAGEEGCRRRRLPAEEGAGQEEPPAKQAPAKKAAAKKARPSRRRRRRPGHEGSGEEGRAQEGHGGSHVAGDRARRRQLTCGSPPGTSTRCAPVRSGSRSGSPRRQPDVVHAAGDEARRRRVPVVVVRGPRLRVRALRAGAVERCGDPVQGRARRRGRRTSPAMSIPTRMPASSPRPVEACASAASTSPTGASLDDPHYTYKLSWLDRLVAHLDADTDPSAAVLVGGDFNIAPADRDVYDPAKFVGATHVSQPERDRLGALEAWGLVDVFRDDARRRPRVLVVGLPRRRLPPGPRPADRPAHVFAPRSPTGPTWCVIDRNARKGKSPSDHAPVIVDLDL